MLVAHKRQMGNSQFLLVSRREAQLDVEGQFLVRIIYEDSKTYDLVAAASKVLSKCYFWLVNIILLSLFVVLGANFEGLV